MPSFCLYGMCHNLGSSTYQGYCNEYHLNRARVRELREQLEVLSSISTVSQSQSKDSELQIPLTKAPSSELRSKQHDKSPVSCNREMQRATASVDISGCVHHLRDSR
jgi:hypothetical protein